MNRTLRSTLLAGVASLAIAAASPALAQGAGPTAPGSGTGFFVNAEFLYGQLFGADIYALSVSNYNGPNSYINQSPEWGPGFRVGAGWRSGGAWDVGIAFSYLVGNLENPSATAPGTINGSCCYGVNTPYGTAYDSAQASGNWNRFLVDVDAGYNMAFGPGFNVRWSAGLRYARLSMTQTAWGSSLNFSGCCPDLSFAGQANERFTGFGPRFGADATVGVGEVGGGRVSFVMGAGASILLGSRRSQSAENRISYSGTPYSYSYTQSENAVVPMLDTTLGVRWSSVMGGLPVSMTLGYRADVMIGATTGYFGKYYGKGSRGTRNVATQSVFFGTGVSF